MTNRIEDALNLIGPVVRRRITEQLSFVQPLGAVYRYRVQVVRGVYGCGASFHLVADIDPDKSSGSMRACSILTHVNEAELMGALKALRAVSMLP